ncbi:hypothetical protein AB0D04_15915 [Streptomyces sp. NPDC048483]
MAAAYRDGVVMIAGRPVIIGRQFPTMKFRPTVHVPSIHEPSP